MTAVIPLTLDNDGNLVQMSSSTILDYQQRAIVNFARDPSVSLAEITTGGSLNSMIDTRRKAGPARGTEDSALNETTDEVDNQQDENQEEISINQEDDTDDLNQSDVEETSDEEKAE